MGRTPRCTAPEIAIGKKVSVPASLFGSRWAQETYGARWREQKLEGEVVSFVPKGSATAKGSSKHDIWNLMFPGDTRVYPQKWCALIKWLSDEDVEALSSKCTKIQKVTSLFLCVVGRFA